MTDTMPDIPVAGQDPWDEDLNACLTWLYEHVEALEEAGGVLAPQVAQNVTDIDANQASIVNLSNDLGAMFTRLLNVETQAGINASNINSLGDRLTALEARVMALENAT